MDKFDYDIAINDIKKLERQFQKIKFEKDFLDLKKPSIINYHKRKDWEREKNLLIQQEENIYASLLIAYAKLEQLF